MPYNEPPEIVAELKQSTAKSEIEAALFRRDFVILESHWPDIITAIEKAVNDNHTPQEIKHWIQSIIDDQNIIQRAYNAARHLAGQR